MTIQKLRITDTNTLIGTIDDAEMQGRIWVLNLYTGKYGRTVVPRTATE